MKKSLMFVCALMAFALAPMSAVNHKTVWIESLGGLDGLVRESIERKGTVLHVGDSREESDLVLLLDERGPDYAQTLLREKLGRRDATVLVARDTKSGKVLATQPVTLNPSQNGTAIDRFLTRLTELP